jgi:hypothetical protein
MEKIIEIDGKKVTLKTNGSCTKRYKMQFQRDFFADILKLNFLTKFKNADGEVNLESMTDSDIARIDMDIFVDMLWVFAKTADPKIPEPLTWLSEFDEFPVFELISENMDLLVNVMHSSKKK